MEHNVKCKHRFKNQNMKVEDKEELNANWRKEHLGKNGVLHSVIEEFCPKCKSINVVEISDHYTKCLDCKFEFVG
jgi:phage FluMu protein Com